MLNIGEKVGFLNPTLMLLKEYLPLSLQYKHSVPSIEAGVVVKMFVPTVTPPKYKRVIVVGLSPDGLQAAFVYINSKINKRVHCKRKAQKQQKYLDSTNRDYLDRPSYVDCTQLVTIEKEKIINAVRKCPSQLLGWTSPYDFNLLKDSILSSPTIKGKYKNKFGFYA